MRRSLREACRATVSRTHFADGERVNTAREPCDCNLAAILTGCVTPPFPLPTLRVDLSGVYDASLFVRSMCAPMAAGSTSRMGRRVSTRGCSQEHGPAGNPATATWRRFPQDASRDGLRYPPCGPVWVKRMTHRSLRDAMSRQRQRDALRGWGEHKHVRMRTGTQRLRDPCDCNIAPNRTGYVVAPFAALPCERV